VSTSPSYDHLRAGRQLQDVVQHHAIDGHLLHLPSRTTCAFGAVSTLSRSSVRFARSSCTMPMPAFAIRTKPEQRVLDRTDDQDDGEHRAEQRVEPREDVRADDLRHGPRVRSGHRVDLATGFTFGHLGRAQTPIRIDHAGSLPAGFVRPSARRTAGAR
jgi:hypothetical protein